MKPRPDYAREIRSHLADPITLCRRLGFDKDAVRQASGLTIRCPWHTERTPSCSVTRGPDGTVRVRCFGCDASGDALHLVAVSRGLDPAHDFVDVLVEAAGVAGLHALVDEIRGDREPAPCRPVAPPLPPPEPPREYPPAEEVQALWDAAGPVGDDAEACRMLVTRKIDPEALDARRLSRVIPPGAEVPSWARYRGDADRSRPWTETGHRLILRMWDPAGRFRSVRGWRLVDGKPKRLPPAGHNSTGLVLANREAVGMLMGRTSPWLVLVAEGEPDWTIHATRSSPGIAVLGVISGSWNPEFAERIPVRARVVIRTHRDEAGERYAAAIVKSLGERCPIYRAKGAAA